MKMTKLNKTLRFEYAANNLWSTLSHIEKMAYSTLFANKLFEIADNFGSEDWWHELSPEGKKQYCKEHPGSKYAKIFIQEQQNKPKPRKGPYIPSSPRVKQQKESPRNALVEADKNPDYWPEHIKKLKLPPAWTHVSYSMNPDNNLQAIGRDKKGREQSVYHEKFVKSQAALKFTRIAELHKKRHQIHQQIKLAQTNPDPTVQEHGDCARLIMEMGLRPGSEDDTKAEKRAHGASTLEGHHVVAQGDDTYLQFVGKKGVDNNLKVENPEISEMLRKRAEKAGHGGKLFPQINEKSLLNYIHTLDGGSFKTKDMRTLKGTEEAQALVKSMKPPTNHREYKAAVMTVAKHVASKLGNTPAIALSAYISPTVFAKWQATGIHHPPSKNREQASINSEGTFTHENRQYSLSKLLQLVENNPIENIALNKLVWIFKFDNPLTDDPQRILPTDLTQPILITKSYGKWVVLDGLHRIGKAEIEGLKKLPAKIISREQLQQCRIIKEQSSANDRFLRTAIKTNSKIYAGHQGQEHDNLIDSLDLKHGSPEYEDYTRGYIHGFLNHKSQFMLSDSGDAAKYAIENNLLHPEVKPYVEKHKFLVTDNLPRRQFGKIKKIPIEKARIEQSSANDRYLRTAVKTPKAIYAGHQGQSHESLLNSLDTTKDPLEFDKITHGFLNHKNRFLSAEHEYVNDASKYAVENDLVFPHVKNSVAKHGNLLSEYVINRKFGKTKKIPIEKARIEQALFNDRYLRTAIKTPKAIYAGHQGQPHDHLMDSLDMTRDPQEFSKIKRGFLNHKNQFLRAESSDATKYAIENDLVHPRMKSSLTKDNYLTTDDVAKRQFGKTKKIQLESASIEQAWIDQRTTKQAEKHAKDSWWAKMSADEQRQYLQDHPHSHFKYGGHGIHPLNPEFQEALASTKDATSDENGIHLKVTRYQKGEQEGESSIRDGVFFIPHQEKSYKGYKTPVRKEPDAYYGGSHKFTGEKHLKSPIIVKASTGGRAPEAAYIALHGRNKFEAMNNACSSILGINIYSNNQRLSREDKIQNIQNVLDEYGGNTNLAEYIYNNSGRGNQLRYALQENIIANQLKKHGYDSMLAYNRRGWGHKGHRLTELFDLNTTHYPKSNESSSLYPGKAWTRWKFFHKKSMKKYNDK
jgi:DNA topoisomerase-1